MNELESTLQRSPALALETLSAEERERMELLQDLGQDLLIGNAAGPAENAAHHSAALALVRHLARCGR